MLSVGTIKNLDKYVGGFLCRIVSKKEIKPERISSILVIQLWGIGESILTLPAIHAIHKKFPKAWITVLATERNHEVFRENRDIGQIKVLPLNPFRILRFIRKNRNAFDLAVDMEEYLNISALIAFYAGKERIGYSHGKRSRLYTKKVDYNDMQHAVQTFLDLSRAIDASAGSLELIELSPDDLARQKIHVFLKENGILENDRVVGLAPGAAESARCRMWPKENFAKLADALVMEYKAKIFFIGAESEHELIQDIQDRMENKGRTVNAAGKVSLSELFVLVKRCMAFISNDSGPMHIAAAQKVPTVGLFGPNTPVRFGPYGKNNIAVYKGDVCTFSPCINVHLGQTPDCLFKKNSQDYQKCIKNISVGDVFGAVGKVLQNK